MENKFYMVTVNIFVFDEDDIETKDRFYLCGIFPEIKEAEKYCKELFEKWSLHTDELFRNSSCESKMHIVNSKNKTKYCICHEEFELTDLRCYHALRDMPRLECSLGTLGGGNHFIEIDRTSEGKYCLVIHSGSRNLGKQVAEYYQQLAVDLHRGKEDYARDREQLVRTYKEQGRSAEIQKALQQPDILGKQAFSMLRQGVCGVYAPAYDAFFDGDDLLLLQDLQLPSEVAVRRLCNGFQRFEALRAGQKRGDDGKPHLGLKGGRNIGKRHGFPLLR